MADLKLKDGREIEIDLYRITIKEWRSLFDSTQPDEDGDKIIAKICELDLDDVQGLPYPEYRRLVEKVFERSRKPLEDTDGNPN